MQKASPAACRLRSEELFACSRFPELREKELDGEEKESIEKDETDCRRRFHDLPDFPGLLRAGCIDLHNLTPKEFAV